MEVESLYREPDTDGQVEWPILEMHDVFKIYRSGPVETVALRGVDLELRAGTLAAILGPSGCGKSTLLALAAGLDRASAGEVRSDGVSLLTRSEEELAAYRSRSVGIVFQSGNLWPNLTARENVIAVLRLAGLTDAPRRAAESLVEFGLGGRTEHRAAALSGGEQQRVAIAAAAAREARIVLADEPTAELDERNEELVLDALRRLRDELGSTVVIVTHAQRIADAVDRVVELRDGKVVA
jgi:ABC-type lipoprotein export system ATPase subunit